MEIGAIKRLNKELLSFKKDPNPALEILEPVDDDNMLLWKGCLLGVSGTPYEGKV